MTKNDFEKILNRACDMLSTKAKEQIFKSSAEFENAVREVLSDLSGGAYEIDFNSKAQAFPDIAIGEFGVEVKFTLNDTWRSIANSILETQRVKSVKYIYLIFGKMGGEPSVKWADYENSVIHVRTSHVPRFEVQIDGKESLFAQMGISYDEFSKLQMRDKMRHIRAYAKKIHPDGRLWWIDDNNTEHSVPLQARLYTNLTSEEKLKLRAEAALLCPKIVSSGRKRDKYDDLVLFLLTYHGVLAHQARDLFSAGSVANPKNDDSGGVYIARALKLLESEMIKAAFRLDDALFVEYWGHSVAPKDRIAMWLQKADSLAKNWVPSQILFLDYDK